MLIVKCEVGQCPNDVYILLLSSLHFCCTHGSRSERKIFFLSFDKVIIASIAQFFTIHFLFFPYMSFLVSNMAILTIIFISSGH